MKSYNKGTIIGALIGGVFGLALTVGAVALASPHGPHAKGHRWTPDRMEQHLANMTDRLSLSSAQEAQVRTILEQARSRAQEIKEMPRGREKFTALRDLRFETEDQIYANLSCAQREELRLLKREHKAKRMQERWERRQAGDLE